MSRIFGRLAFIWASCLPLLVPYGAYRNIDLQGLVLILAGISAWVALLLDRQRFPKLGRWPYGLLAVFLSFCVLDVLVTPHLDYNLLGAPFIRLGSLGLLSCVGVGLLASRVETQRLIRALYWYSAVVVLVSVIYSWHFGVVQHRLGGVFNQADLLACVAGVGILLGWPFCTGKTWAGRGHIIVQLALSTVLILTQTRAVIGLTLLLSAWILLPAKPLKPSRLIPLAGTAVVLVGLLFLAIHLAPHNRLHDVADAKFSTHYRLDLNHAAVSASVHRPLFGYGPGNLADALDCKTLHAKPLLKTCHDGYFFNSSHDIYLDRFLGLGWLAGVAYAALVIWSLIRGRNTRQLQAIRLLIALYYLTNVTSIVIELLFWVVIVQGLADSKIKRT